MGSGMHGRAGQRTETGWRRLWRRVFRQRQILLRSDAGVRCLHLSPRLQQAMAAAVLALVAWFAGMGGGLVWQQERLAERGAELARAHDAYADLNAEVDAAREQAVALLAQLGDAGVDGRGSAPGSPALSQALRQLRTGVASLAARNSALADRVARVRRDLRRADARAESLAAARVRLEEELAATRMDLSAVVDRRRVLAHELAETRADLKALRASRQAEANGRLQAEDKARRLARDLAATRADEADLRERLQDLEQQVAESKDTRSDLLQERRELAQRVGRLEDTLGSVTEAVPDGAAGGSDLAGRIAGLEKALLAAESKGTVLAAERDRLRGKVRQLQARLDSLRQRQSGVLAHFRDRARHGLDPIERTVAMTGLDVDALVARVREEAQALGGPFIPAAGEMDGPLSEEVQRLEREMQRLVALRAALRSLPLTAPLDAYWISSYFGKRRDPYNGRWAQHEGLDLAAQHGSPVVAAAPGKVVFTGRKPGYGRMVEIDHGYGIRTRYGHLDSIAVQAGTRLEHRGEIGKVGDTGRSTGSHLHYEIRVNGEALDPMNFLEAGKHVFKG